MIHELLQSPQLGALLFLNLCLASPIDALIVSKLLYIGGLKWVVKMKSYRVCVLGLGYIGLPTAALLANRGHQIHGVDVNSNVVDTINQGQIHIVEPDLDTFVHSAVHSGRLRAALQPVESDVFIIAVPTPFKGDFEPDLKYVVAASQSIAPYVRAGNLVILESTSPVGSTEVVRDTLAAAGIDVSNILFAHCPERVLPGKVMIELIENDRIVGGLDDQATAAAVEFYKTFVNGQILTTDARTAEMAKLTENSFRDVNIAFANELSLICAKQNINVWELIRLANHHPRVNILQPGCGVGGHCIAVDPWFIVHQSPVESRLIRTAREVNDGKPTWVLQQVALEAQKLRQQLGREPIIAVMGLAFKPDIDDLRESPAVHIAQELQSLGYQLRICEPNIEQHPKFEISKIQSATTEADLLVFLVAHTPFKTLNIQAHQVVIDVCGVRKATHA